MNELLYLQGLKDGMQLATSLADHLHAFEGLGYANTNNRKPVAHMEDSGGSSDGSENQPANPGIYRKFIL